MRYERISPDSEPVSNGKRINLKTYREDEEEGEDKEAEEITNGGIRRERFRSPSKTTHNNGGVVVGGGGGGGEVLQWGHRKRSRCFRGLMASTTTTTTTTTDDSSSSSSSMMQQQQQQFQQINKHKKRSSSANVMPPPPSLPPCNIVAKVSNIKSTASPIRRSSEDRSGAGIGKKSGVSSPSSSARSNSNNNNNNNKVGKRSADDKMNGSTLLHQQHRPRQEAATAAFDASPRVGSRADNDVNINDNNLNKGKMIGGGEKMKGGGGGGGGGEVIEWPRIYIPLSRKEKEEDFLAMKGTKLPHRPKKRPKPIDRILQYCYPGMWLPDLTKGRYEVREKKSTKKQKRRGLKGMEIVESESE